MIEPSDVRDLEQEGVLGAIDVSQAWSVGVHDAFMNAKRDCRIQGLEVRCARLEEVLSAVLKKQGETTCKPLN